MIKNTKLGFIRIALAAVVGLPLFIATSAFAQTTPATGGEATAERVIVTGSNIPTAEEVTASPVDTLTTADVDRSGSSDVLGVLTKRNPDFVGAGNIGSSNANVASGNSLGGALITIRGLPTLVLLNGRRIADSAAIAVGGAQFSDVNLIPTALISRIEVLKDGASALYGSEAVGGVVNIFMKQEFTGVEAGFRYGFSVESGVAERRSYVIAGVGNDTTHVTAGFQYYEIDPLFMRERFYSRLPLGGTTTTFGGVGRDAAGGNAGTFYLLNGVDPKQPFGTAGFNSPFDAGVAPGSIAPPPGPQYGSISPGVYHAVPQSVVTGYDLSLIPTSTQKIRNTDAYASFTHQICGKQLEIFGDFLYANNNNESFLNAQPLSNGTGVIILGSKRVDPVTGAIVAENRGPAAAFNPFQLSIDSNTLSGSNRLTAANRYQTNPRIFKDDSDFYRFLGGFRSEFVKDKWWAEAAAYYSHYGINYINQNLVNALQLNSMIAGTALDNNGANIPSLDFFARNPVGTNPGQVTLDQFNTIFGSNLRRLDSYQRSFDFRVTGFPFELPGGPLGVAAGVEYRIEGFKVKDSPEIFVGSVPIQEIQTGRAITSFNAELKIPIVGSQMNVPFIYSLELSLAGRYDIYEGLSEDAKVPKYTLRYQPIKDLTLRATYSNSFVAPTLYQLFGPSSTGFSDTINFPETPAGTTEDQAQVQTGSNPNLVPSTAESYTAGLVYSPSYLPGFVLTADYFRTLQQQIVGTLGGNTILQSVEALGTASPYYSLVSFNNFPGQPGARQVTGPGPNQSQGLTGNMAATFYLDTNINIGAARVEGFDLSAHYTLEMQRWGALEFGVNSVVFTKNDLRRLAETPYYNISGLVGSEFFGTNPDYKITFLAEYRFEGLTLSVNANYIPEMLNSVGKDPETQDQSTFVPVDDYITVDGRLSYEFRRKAAPPPTVPDAKDGKDKNPIAQVVASCFTVDHFLDGLRLTVGCNNMLDEDPRIVAGGNSSTNLATYDPFGRFVYFEVSKKF